MTITPHNFSKAVWVHAAAAAACLALVGLSFYVMRLWLNAAPPLVMIPVQPVPEEPASAPIGLANPASANCASQGGRLEIETGPDGGQYGLCWFESGAVCEEWAMLRGDCPVGGVTVLSAWEAADVYCAARGGEVLRVNGGLEPSRCLFRRND